MRENPGEFCLLSTTGSASEFCYFAYARQLFPAPPAPLRQIFSQMWRQQSSFLVEEHLPPNDSCEWELEVLRGIKGNPSLSRRVVRLSFFHVPGPALFRSNRKDAVRGANVDREIFAAMADQTGEPGRPALRCLGFLYLYCDYADKECRTPIGAYVHAAVIHPFTAPDFPQYVHSKARFAVHVLGRVFHVTGSYFAQQQGETTCCAHAAIMVAVRNICTARPGPAGERPPPLTYRRMNEIIGMDYRKRVARSGLHLSEIRHLLLKAGLSCQTVDSRNFPGKDQFPPETAVAFAYHAIECGLPAIVCFPEKSADTTSHALAAIGHTFNPQLWRADETFRRECGNSERPELAAVALAPYLPSHNWMDGIILQDDHFGPHCIVPAEKFIRREYRPAVIFPAYSWQGKVVAGDVEVKAARKLTHYYNTRDGTLRTLFESIRHSPAGKRVRGEFWYERIREIADASLKLLFAEASEPPASQHPGDLFGRYVLRAIPCKREHYKHFLRHHNAYPGSARFDEMVNRLLAGGIAWMVEVSLPELYQWNHLRLGEILFSAGKTFDDCRTLLIRLPGVLTLFEPESRDLTHHPIPFNSPCAIEKRIDVGYALYCSEQ